MKQNKKTMSLLALLTINFLHADFVDIQREVYEPAEEMQKMDEAMNRAMDQRRQENQLFINEQATFDIEEPMPEFIFEENQYVLRKNIEDAQHTKVKVSVEQGMLKISTITTITQEIITETGSQSSSSESTMQESLSLPHNADVATLESEYKDGKLKVTFNKKK